jgi:hypothetical protein
MRGERLYRLLIALYPKRFREAWRDELLSGYRERARAMSGAGIRERVRFLGLIAEDVLRSVPAEHLY